MAERSQSDYRGILITDPRVTTSNIWSAHSTYTEATPRTGSPAAQVPSDLVLEGVGDQSAGKQLRIKAQKGGHPGPDGAGFVWREQGDTNYRGWNFPSSITSWEVVVSTDGTGSTRKARNPHAITLADGTILCAHTRTIVDGGTLDALFVTARAPAAGVLTHVEVARALAVLTFGYRPALVELPNGRVLLFAYDASAAGVIQVRMYYSDNSGATWATGSASALLAAIDISGSPGAGATGYDPGKMSAAYADGQILLVIELELHNESATNRTALLQVVSGDLGTTFAQVELGTYSAGRPSVLVAYGQFYIFTILGTSGAMQKRQIANAYQKISAATATTESSAPWGVLGSGNRITEGWIASALDDAGGIHVLGTHSVGDRSSTHEYSKDGITFGLVHSNPETTFGASWYDQGDSATYPSEAAATFQRGRLVVFHSWETDVSTFDNSLAVAYLGGYSDLTLPKSGDEDTNVKRAKFGTTYLPLELPENVGWTAAGAGTGSLISGALRTTGTAQRKYTKTPSGTIAEGLLLVADLGVTASGVSWIDTANILARLDDGSAGYEVSIRLKTGTLRLYDENDGAGTQIGGDVSIDATAGVQVLLAMNTAKVRLWYRLRSTGEDTQWTAGPTSAALVDDSGSVGTNRIEWGTKIIGSGIGITVTANWRIVQYATDDHAGDGLADGQTNPADLFPRSFAASAVYVDGGAAITAIDGPAFPGDNWNIDTRYEFPIVDILPAVAPSPSAGWRSTGEIQQTIAFQLDGSAEARPLNDVIALHLEGVNWRTGKLQGYDLGTTAWVDLVSLDTATGQSAITFDRTGGTIHRRAGTTAGRWYYIANELAGATAELVGGSTVRRKIATNTEGVWRDGTAKNSTILLDGALAGDPANGTLRIWSRRLTAIVHLGGATYQGYRILIDAQATADGYFEIGSAVLGPVFVFGRDYSWGRIRSIEPNVEVSTALDGSRRSRKLGNARRAVDFGWTEGVDLTQLGGNNPDPDYALGTTTGGAEPIAIGQEGPLLMYGLADYLDGPHTPCVYLPRIQKGTPDTAQFVTRGYAIYGRLAGGVRLETVQGTEQVDEVTRVATVTIEEEL